MEKGENVRTCYIHTYFIGAGNSTLFGPIICIEFLTEIEPHFILECTIINLLPELYLMGGAHTVRQGRNLLFYRQPGPKEWATVRDYLVRLETDIIQNWVINAEHILARVQYEDEQITATADILMDSSLVQIQPGSSATDLKRLEVLVELFATAHLMRDKGFTVNTVVLFQPLSGLWLEMDISTWDGTILDTYLRSRIAKD